MERIFREHGVDVHRHEVDELYDDHDKQERYVKVRKARTMVGFGKAG